MPMNQLIKQLRYEIITLRGLSHFCRVYHYDPADLSRFLAGQTKWNYQKVFKLITDLELRILVMQWDNVVCEFSRESPLIESPC